MQYLMGFETELTPTEASQPLPLDFLKEDFFEFEVGISSPKII